MKNLDLPNPFDWSKYSVKGTKQQRDHIMENPYGCDNCCDIYHKDDLINYLNSGTLICRNCIEEYDRNIEG